VRGSPTCIVTAKRSNLRPSFPLARPFLFHQRAPACLMNNVLILIHGYPFDRTFGTGSNRSSARNILPLTLDLPGFGAAPASLAEPSLE